ncbi:hypothetical protein [Frondihabitans australicus]|uniref:Uncharacterized protein n=1 Tax=Frondihabitans australicus TaxID=386892 RepID=A0A495IE00_9MICO|nr:hypothetical protein [Frondihabitans australicus]RKR73236.1 hypothetical protein C8E83_0326 [Frondihabitans australicus]
MSTTAFTDVEASSPDAAQHHPHLSEATDRRIGKAIAAVATAGMVTSVTVAVLSALGLLR